MFFCAPAAARLAERPFIRENPYALWSYHLHALIRSTLHTADDATDDRWTDADWRAAATRALAAPKPSSTATPASRPSPRPTSPRRHAVDQRRS
ncbi:hypothetical protein [Streptomyces sp. NPDC058092]|uniref:hypothetical protein n=1 Tax=Streptomyces sp. NPDC058092 TaxID=3346336 RepID=UPI0036E302B1